MIQSAGYSFPKSERLHHRSLVEGLYRSGHSFYEFPFRVTWRVLTPEQLEKNFRNVVPEGIAKLQMMVTVPKKKRRRAVDRVQMRRRIREAYRLNRLELRALAEESEELGTLSVALVYIHDKNLPYGTVEEKLLTVLGKLRKRVFSSKDPADNLTGIDKTGTTDCNNNNNHKPS